MEITYSIDEILENVLADPDPYIQNGNLYNHIYAWMLLAHFRESKAHDVIIELFSLPNAIPHDLFGDELGMKTLKTPWLMEKKNVLRG